MDSVFGRSKPVQPDLDALFRLPGATLNLEAEIGYKATGEGSVAFRAPAGKAFDEVQSDIEELLTAPGLAGDAAPDVQVEIDSFGYTWLVLKHDDSDVPGLVTDLHVINSTLADSGFGPSLLCSLVTLADPDGRRLALVYLFKQGTFYPFVPMPGAEQRRDNLMELQVRDLIAGELPVEPTLNRWFAIWGAPGL